MAENAIAFGSASLAWVRASRDRYDHKTAGRDQPHTSFARRSRPTRRH